MARRRKTSVLEDIFEIAAMLPWWIGASLAVIAYFWIHHYAIADVPTASTPGLMGQMMVGNLVKSLSRYLQYIVPAVLLAGAATSYFGRRKRQRLITDVATDKKGSALRNMSWREFEMLVGEAFRMKGFVVTETGGGGSDGGIDLELRKDNELFLVQCKQWRAYKVSVNIVRELFGVMAAQGATGGFVVTSGVFTSDARHFAEGRNITLIDGAELQSMIEQARLARPLAEPISSAASQTEPPSRNPSSLPVCPRCGSAMVKRIAKRGSNARGAFWGCSGYPECRGIRAME